MIRTAIKIMTESFLARRFAATVISALALTFASVSISLLLAPDSAQAIVRVKVAPEVGQHIFQLDLGGTGSFEDFAGDAGFAWSAGWTYHADNTLGLGVTVGRNLSESNIPTGANTLLDFDYTYVAASVHLRAPTRSALIPHLQAGFGYYNLNIDERNPATDAQIASIDEDDFGMFFGLGIDYLIAPNLSLGVIGNLHYISLDQGRLQTQGLGDWYDTWDIKGVVTVYTR